MLDGIGKGFDVWSAARTNGKSPGRGSNGKTTAYGVKKLRELILELAVRGKLVPQDPADEPASVLLEKIAYVKVKLIKQGKLKKQKELPAIKDEEEPFNLPGEWEWARLGAITNYGQLEKAKASEVGGDEWVLELEDVEKETSRLLQKARYRDRQFRSDKNRFQKHDVIYGKLRPYLDKVLVADEAGVCTTEMIPIRGFAHIPPQFLRMVMKSPYFISYANNSTHGMNLPRLGTDKARMAIFPVAPECEQHRIVAKVDELMALCDALEAEQSDSIAAHKRLVECLLGTLTAAEDAHAFADAWRRIADHFDTLFTTEHSIDQLKQCILQLAVMGKLVPQDPADEPACVLLEKIAEEKARLVDEGKLRNRKRPMRPGDDEEPFQLPKKWKWARLADVSYQITDGAHHTPRYVSEGVPFLSVKDMSSGYLDFSDTRFITVEQHQELSKRCRPKKGDLLLTKVGTTGIPVLVETDVQFSIFVSVALIKFPTDKLDGKYLSLLVKSPLVKEQSKEGTEGIGNKNLVLRKIGAFKMAIPPLAEQHRIVVKVDELMSVCDGLKARLREAQATQVHLADAVVAQAVG